MPYEVRRLLLGAPVPTAAEGQERLSRPKAIGAFGLDALSSVAYGPDEILYALLLAGSAGLAFDLPVAAAIAILLAIVAFSYRQTIYAVHRHYNRVHQQLAIDHLPDERYAPGQVIVPVSHLNRAAAMALNYARSISENVLAVHVVAEADADPDEFARRWREWTNDRIRLQIVPSPYREVVSPLVELIEKRARDDREPVTVVLPAVVTRHVWQEPLHNQLEYVLTLALLGKPNVVIASVPTRLAD